MLTLRAYIHFCNGLDANFELSGYFIITIEVSSMVAPPAPMNIVLDLTRSKNVRSKKGR